MRKYRSFLILVTMLLSACGGRGGNKTSSNSNTETSSGTSTSEQSSSGTSTSTSASSSSSEDIQHNYSLEWSYDENVHYHACIDVGFEHLRKDEAPHHMEVIDQQEATFEDEGYKTYKCNVCPYEHTDIIPVLEHNYSSDYLDIDDREYHYQACIDPGYENLVKKSPHNYTVNVVVPTYESEGYTEHTCKECHYSYKDDYKDRLEHHYGDYTYDEEYHYRYCTDPGYEYLFVKEAHEMEEEVIEPTFEAGGYTRHYCKAGCGYEYHDNETPKKEHTYAEEWSYDEVYHWQACLDKGYEDLKRGYSRHDESNEYQHWVDSTYEGPGYDARYCEICDYEVSRTIVDQKTHGLLMALNEDEESYAVVGTDELFDNHNVIIPSTFNNLPVTRIGYGAFKNKSLQAPVDLPSSITTINDEAFMNNPQMTGIFQIPENVTTIGVSAFEYTGINQFNLPDGLLTIGNRAFAKTQITIGTLPDSVVEVGEGIYAGCSKLTTLRLPFFGKTKDIAPNNNTTDTILGHYFDKVSFDNSVKITQYYGIVNSNTVHDDFYFPNGLTTIELRGGTSIPDYAFYGVNTITTLHIPLSVVNFNRFAFYNMTGLSTIYYGGDITNWASIETKNNTSVSSSPLSNIHNTNMKLYVADENGEVNISGNHYTLPHEVNVDFCEKIPDYFLTNLSQITSITIADGVTSVGYFAFAKCTNLKSLVIPDTVTYIDANIIYGCSALENLRLSKNAAPQPFDGCKKLKTVVMPSVYRDLLGDCFLNDDGPLVYQYPNDNDSQYYRHIPTSLQEITIQGGSIPRGYLSGDTRIQKVTFGKDVTGYGYSQFRANNSLEEVVFEKYPFNEESEGNGYNECSIGKLFSTRSYAGCNNRVQLYNGIKYIPEDNAFESMYGVEVREASRYYFPSSLKKIEVKSGTVSKYAFTNIDSIKEITFGKDVTLSYSYCCADMDGLEVVNLEAGITIASNLSILAFKDSNNIKTVNFKGTEEEFLEIKDRLGFTCEFEVNYIE